MRKDEHQKTFGKNYEQPVQQIGQSVLRQRSAVFVFSLVLPGNVQTQLGHSYIL